MSRFKKKEYKDPLAKEVYEIIRFWHCVDKVSAQAIVELIEAALQEHG